MDHFPLISSSLCYARSDQEDFSLPRVCSGLAYALRRAGRSQRKWLSSHCRRRSGTKSRQRRDQGSRAQFHPRPPPRHCLGFSPFATQFLQMTKAALLHHHLTTPPPRPARPRALQLTAFSSAPFATPVKARQTSGSEVGMGTAPSGAPAPQTLPPYLLPISGLLPGPNMAFLVLRPLPAVTAKVIACEAGQSNCPTGPYPKVSGLGYAFPDAGN